MSPRIYYSFSGASISTQYLPRLDIYNQQRCYKHHSPSSQNHHHQHNHPHHLPLSNPPRTPKPTPPSSASAPPRARTRIYAFCAASLVQSRAGSTTYTEAYFRLWRYTEIPALLLTCKAISREARPFLYGSARVRFMSGAQLALRTARLRRRRGALPLARTSAQSIYPARQQLHRPPLRLGAARHLQGVRGQRRVHRAAYLARIRQELEAEGGCPARSTIWGR
ncbi:hypothetical protein F4810DRAFT_503377 [Camillea tinctor]|nr:hypothetical protein F4810DRAFT_503377 [Camillea tinctor]